MAVNNNLNTNYMHMNAPPNLYPMQNGQLGSPLMHSGQWPRGFALQNVGPHSNPMVTFGAVCGPPGNFMQNTNQMCNFQPPGQLLMHNWMNTGQLPNAQIGFNNLMQNNNQFVALQRNHGHVVPYNAPPCLNNTLGHLNQVTQSVAPQNTAISMSPPFVSWPNGVGQLVNPVAQVIGPQHPGMVLNSSYIGQSDALGHCNPGPGQAAPFNTTQSLPYTVQHAYQGPQSIDQNKLAVCLVGGNSISQSPPVLAQNLQGSMPGAPTSCADQPGHRNNNLTPSGDMGVQASCVKDGGNTFNSSGRKPLTKKFKRDPRSERSSWGVQKSHRHHKQNVERKFSKKKWGKGPNDKAGKADHGDTSNQTGRDQRRSRFLNYTENEIQQWKEERKKNYPSKANVEKKLRHKPVDPLTAFQDAKLRRQQLKEILAKQAELGVEVAEIPAHYLSDSENQGHGREDVKEALPVRGRVRNRHNKRGRHDPKNMSAKKQIVNKKASLLQKLLSADIRREKLRLLQAFRFMLMNSCLKNWPEKPLKFPSVIVKESECIGMSVLGRNGALECSDSALIDDYENLDADVKDDTSTHFKDSSYSKKDKVDAREDFGISEEGEITD